MPHSQVFTVIQKRIDYATAAQFHDDLFAAVGDGTVRLAIDLGAVESISSVGLRALVMAAKTTKAGGGEIVVAALQPLVREVFTISRFDKILPIYDDLDAAREALGSL